MPAESKPVTAKVIPPDIFKVAVDISGDGIAIIRQNKCVYVNKRFLAIFRMKESDIIGKNLLNFVHPEDEHIAAKEQEQNRKTSYELRVVRGDGAVVHTEVRVHPVECHGEKCRLLALRDITKRKTAENNFSNYSSLLNSIPQAIYVLSSNGAILFSNRNGEKMAASAIPGTATAGSYILDYILPEYHNSLKTFLSELKDKREAACRFVKFRSADGKEPKNIEMWAINVEWEYGKAVMVICHDITLEEQVEKSEITKQAISSVNEHLQWELKQHARLQERLQKMVEEKEWLLKEVNHRVKNNLQILTSILNLQINQLQDNQLLPVMREFQNRFYALSSIFTNLYHRGDSEEIDLSKYLRHLAESLSVSYNGPGNNISIVCEAEHILIDYDEAITFGLIVNELISNSIKYAFPGGRKGLIKVTLKKPDGMINLTVSDDGIGSKTVLNHSTHDSLGMQLVDSLITQLKDSHIKKKTGKKGTCFEITCSYQNKIHSKVH